MDNKTILGINFPNAEHNAQGILKQYKDLLDQSNENLTDNQKETMTRFFVSNLRSMAEWVIGDVRNNLAQLQTKIGKEAQS